jgi:RNA recognition motif-containing protein
MNIFLTNFSSGISSHDVERLFRRYGDVGVASIWVDREERSLRFAIIEMEDDDEGERAVKKLHGRLLVKGKFAGQRLWVQEVPLGFADMLDLCAEAPNALSSQRSLLDDEDDEWITYKRE